MGAATIGHFAINQYLYSKMPYDAERDMVPASLTWELPNVFVVASDHCPAKTVSEFISWAKQRGRVSYGSPGVGTSPHLSGVMFVKRTGLDAVHVPFRGAAQTIPAMLAGDVNFAIDNLTSYVPAISSGKMRALAVTAAQRWPTMADVPTMEEAGMKNFVVTSWAAFVFPAGTPRPIIDKIAGAMKQIAADAEIQKRFQVGGALVLSSTPEGALAYAAKERTLWKDVVAASGAKID
jgi:tripartite-type tricarboxylate transporter receptor subunit TctC